MKIFTIKNLSIILAAILISLFTFWIFCVNHVSYNEIGISYNSRTGEIEKQHTGYHLTPPWVRVTYMSTIPVRVEMLYGQGSRFILPKIVQFQPEFYKEFIQIEGFHYIGSQEAVLREYAFSGKEWSFLKEIK